MRRIIKIGDIFGRLKVVATISGARNNQVCECECGAITHVPGFSLNRGATNSCGCLRRELVTSSNLTHGDSRVGFVSREYKLWQNMLDRCRNRKSRSYARYGGRGIRVCRRWKKFENFLADMGRRPSSKHSLEREKNDKGYAPGNVVWATPTQQARNTRKCRMLTIDGETMCVSAWAERGDAKYRTILGRLNRGFGAKEAVFGK